MKIKGIKYISPLLDSSGYAQASRSYVMALHKLGIPLTLSPVSFEQSRPPLRKEEEEVFKKLMHKKINYNVVIYQLTPEFWKTYYEPGKLNVGYTVWETSKLHTDWPGYMNASVDLIFCPCEWNREVFISSGVKKSISVIPHIIDVHEFDGIQKYDIQGIKEDAFKFYGIFQLIERKHPAALLKSYWSAFPNGENVALILKTYRYGFDEPEKEEVRKIVRQLKAACNVTEHAPLHLILEPLSRDQILSLHSFGDCFVSLDRGEGFGLCGFEAGAAGKPIILTGFGGALEYAKPQFSYLVNYTLTPVFGMTQSPWYLGDQLWAEPDCANAVELMRHVYTHRKEAAAKGKQLRNSIKENFNNEVIGKRIVMEIENFKK